jgi:uncharacterized membrane protein
MMYYGGYPVHGWQMFAGMLAMTALSIALIWAVAWVVATAMQKHERHPLTPHEPDALTILQRRYAAGELDDAEYMRRRQTLLGA